MKERPLPRLFSRHECMLPGSIHLAALTKPTAPAAEIPHACVEIFESVPQKAIIRTQNGSWAVTVKMKRSKPGDDYSFYLQGRGWVDLVKHNGLRKGDILVFSLVGLSQFHLFVFGKTSCLKKPTTGNRLKITRKKNLNRFAQFEVPLKKFNLFGLNVPADFVERTGMQKRKKVMVKDCEGREWPVKVKSESNGGLVLGDGWGDFVKQSGLKVGITCLIQSAIQDDDADDNVLLMLIESDLTL
ncbi:hypothetical protein V2J09_011830 [Rumex salicifolius]